MDMRQTETFIVGSSKQPGLWRHREAPKLQSPGLRTLTETHKLLFSKTKNAINKLLTTTLCAVDPRDSALTLSLFT